MRARTVRRVSQGLFLALMVWFSLVATLGADWWRLSGWPVNWLLELDPLAGLTTLLAGGELYSGMLWGLATLALTLLLGRFFCGWVCPLGALNQFVGWLGRRGKRLKTQATRNQPGPAQRIKYWVLLVLLVAASGDVLALAGRATWGPLALLGLAALIGLAAWRAAASWRGLVWAVIILGLWLVLGRVLGAGPGMALAGLLDPIPLIHRSFSLVALPLVDRQGVALGAPRFFTGAWTVAAVFFAILALNLIRPRFYCRYVCPLGALLGLAGRFSLGRIAKTQAACRDCLSCEAQCEGACAPSGQMRWSECVLCFNCLEACPDSLMTYRAAPSEAGEIPLPDLGRRGVVLGLVGGAALAPGLTLGGGLARGWPAGLIRPPGALDEPSFLSRCIRCGQCMRVCPSGVIQPALAQAGLEGLWTPALDFRVGSGACMVNCVACGQVCPTAAIRPLSIPERRGQGEHEAAGPIRIGTAFLDRGRCLPWAMDRPCIVCQENCPVSPKAIHTRVELRRVRFGAAKVRDWAPQGQGGEAGLEGLSAKPGSLGGGDYYLAPAGRSAERRRVLAHGLGRLTLGPGAWQPAPGQEVAVLVRLQLPFVDPALCVGCGACQHECPVAGRAAIRVTAENETRARGHRLLPG